LPLLLLYALASIKPDTITAISQDAVHRALTKDAEAGARLVLVVVSVFILRADVEADVGFAGEFCIDITQRKTHQRSRLFHQNVRFSSSG
jgi:hypothetical protein